MCMIPRFNVFKCGTIVNCGDFEFVLPSDVSWGTFGRTEEVYVAVGTYSTCRTRFFGSLSDKKVDSIVRSLVTRAFALARVSDRVSAINPALRTDRDKDSNLLTIINLDPQALRRSVKMVRRTLISVEGDSCASVNFLTGSGQSISLLLLLSLFSRFRNVIGLYV